jgi:hypothetical protein
MAKAHASWTILPHGPIEKLSENLWRVEGALANMPLRRVMTLARRTDGGLVVHNAIALGDAEIAEIDAWGEVTAILVPNGYHRLDAPSFEERYPNARVYAPSGARKKVEEVVPVDGTYADFPSDAAVSLSEIDGTAGGEGVMKVASKDGVTLVFNDAIFNMPHLNGAQGFVMRHITQSSGGPRVTRVARFFLVKDKAAFRAALAALADTPDLVRVIVSHHEMITSQPREALLAAAQTL